MADPQPSFDPGLTQPYTGSLPRAINRDGFFNVRRRNGNSVFGSYLHLVQMSWPGFLATVAAAYLVVNTLFARLARVLNAAGAPRGPSS
jgi:hypothetical protein